MGKAYAIGGGWPGYPDETTEFPHLANKYQVYGVPRSVINEVIHIEGAVPESNLISQLMTVQNEAEMNKLKKRWNIN